MTTIAAREAALAIAPKITGGVSFIGSAGITYHILSDPCRRQKTFHRLVALMSICDMISSFCFFLSTWPVPQGRNQGWDRPNHYAAVGNDATCTAQGFGIQFGITTAFFNLMLSIHYLMVVRYHHAESSIKKREPIMIGTALFAGLALSVPALFMSAYNNTNLWCWIAPNWEACAEAGLYDDECFDQTVRYRWLFYYGPLWLTVGLITAAQVCLWWTVRQLEVKASKWRISPRKVIRMRQTRLVATQATWYILVFIITWLPYTIIDLTGLYLTPNDTLGFVLLMVVVICQPIQGSLNVLVYHRQSLAAASFRAATYLGSGLSFASGISKVAGSSRLAEASEQPTFSSIEMGVVALTQLQEEMKIAAPGDQVMSSVCQSRDSYTDVPPLEGEISRVSEVVLPAVLPDVSIELGAAVLEGSSDIQNEIDLADIYGLSTPSSSNGTSS